MPINLKAPQLKELKPRILVCGVGGAGGNPINNMIVAGLSGVDFLVANTDAQALASSRAQRIVQMGPRVTEGLGAGSRPEIGKAAAEETLEEICDHLAGSNMVFLAAGMGGGTGTGAAPVIAADGHPPSRTSRALIGVMENYQEPDGSMAILEVLWPYMGGRTRIEATR